MMNISYTDRRDALVAEKQNSKYDEMAEKYGVNKFYLWHIVNDGDGEYYPPPHVCYALEIPAKMGVICDVDLPDGVYLPRNAKYPFCPTCKRQFIRTSNRMIYCDPDCRPKGKVTNDTNN